MAKLLSSRKVAKLKHKATSPNQMDLEIGDIIGVAGNHWDGYSKGRNLRTNRIGLYPSFKVFASLCTYCLFVSNIYNCAGLSKTYGRGEVAVTVIFSFFRWQFYLLYILVKILFPI